jgi:hypothetical protein
MNNLVGHWIRRFLVAYLIGERNYSLIPNKAIATLFCCFCPLWPNVTAVAWIA